MNDLSLEAPGSPEIEKKPLRIIYIEDQEIFRNFIKEEFKNFFKDVSIISSFSKTEEAMEYLMKLGNGNPDLPDAIVTDNDLGPGNMTGIQFAKRLKEKGFGIPIILFTTDTDDFIHFSKAEREEIGLIRVVNKMIKIKDLVEILKQVKLK